MACVCRSDYRLFPQELHRKVWTYLRVLQMSKHMTLSQKKAASKLRCVRKAARKIMSTIEQNTE